MKCDGQFSEDEYRSLQLQKDELRKEVRAKHDRLSELAHEILRAQKSLAGDELRLKSITHAEEGYELDEPEPSTSSGQPNDELVAFDDSELSLLLSLGYSQDFVGETRQQTPQVS
ncbi:hypothetical protein LTR24_008873 [Lithohypha guttulata]|uniref:Uncharacterized protein n=1 Tax=Lithohypha guttulata TaxID=1690604 RepID=A0ABR0JZ23_9EURO|nr:hypothetical protein LTR24_008873 [Lithohypha guttulata]